MAYARTGGPWLAAAMALDRRLEEVAERPGDATLTRLRLAWWSEAVATLGTGPEPVDPDLLRLAPLLDGRPDRVALVEALFAAWDAQVGEGAPWDRRPLARARAALLLDGSNDSGAVTALKGRAMAGFDAKAARTTLLKGLSGRWPRALRGHRLLARAALHRLEGGSERALAVKLVGWALSGR